MRKRVAAVPAGAMALAIILAGCGGNDGDTGDGAPAGETSSPSAETTSGSEQTSATPSQTSQAVDLYDKTFPVTWKQALEKARKDFSGDVAGVKLESDRGVYQYKIELISDTKSYEVEIDATSGQQISAETEKLDADEVGTERKQERIDLDKIITVRAAMESARAVEDAPIVEWKLDSSRNGPQYEFEVAPSAGGEDHDIDVDALTGKVIPNHDD